MPVLPFGMRRLEGLPRVGPKRLGAEPPPGSIRVRLPIGPFQGQAVRIWSGPSHHWNPATGCCCKNATLRARRIVFQVKKPNQNSTMEIPFPWHGGCSSPDWDAMGWDARHRKPLLMNREEGPMREEGRGGTGSGSGRGRGGQGRGRQGRGGPAHRPARGRTPAQAEGVCVCPRCGYEERHEPGIPCLQKSCARCGAVMTRKETQRR